MDASANSNKNNRKKVHPGLQPKQRTNGFMFEAIPKRFTPLKPHITIQKGAKISTHSRKKGCNQKWEEKG
jgi:hypothetical protein